jgi:hypothetical protein
MYFYVLIIRVLKKQARKKIQHWLDVVENSFWVLWLIYGQVSILQFFVKGMHKMMKLISNFLYKKKMLPFMQLHVHYVNLMKKKITWKFQNIENLKQKATREMIPLLNKLATFLYPLGFKFLALNACHMCRK